MANPGNFVSRAENEMRAIKNDLLNIRERARRLLTEYSRLGSNWFTNQHFCVDGDTAGTERTDLSYSKDEFSNAIGKLADIAGLENPDGTGYKESATSDIGLSKSAMEVIIKITG